MFTILEIYLLLSMFLCGELIFAWQNQQQKRILIARTDIIIVVAYMTIYALLCSINFGHHTRQSQWLGNYPGKRLVIFLHKPTKISSIYFYTGLSKAKLEFNFNDKKFATTTVALDKWPYPYWSWNRLEFASPYLLESITISVKQPVVEIKQLALFDEHQQYVTNAIVGADIVPQQDTLLNIINSTQPIDIHNSYTAGVVFDEMYYATSAYQILHGEPIAADLHPPLGMLVIAFGIKCFGMNPFGWRIMSAVFGTILLPIIYFFAYFLTKSRLISNIATLLLMCDFMHFVMSRLALIDTIVTVFIILEYLCLWLYLQAPKKSIRYLRYSGYCFGCAIATKWSALFAVPALLILAIYVFITYRLSIKEVFSIVWCMMIVPALIYIISYIPYILISKPPELFNYLYHTTLYIFKTQTVGVLAATDKYASSWWTWPLVLRPQIIYDYMYQHQHALVVLMGNPLIWWLTIPSIIYIAANAIIKRQASQAFLVLIICSQYLPYIFIKRLSYIYYFYSITPLAFIAVASVVAQVYRFKHYYVRYLSTAYLSSVCVAFIVFFPALTATLLTEDYIKRLAIYMCNSTISESITLH